jgi:hypothetical protein
MRLKIAGLWVIGVPAVMVTLAFGFYYLILDWHGRPACHKVIMGAFDEWMSANGMDTDSRTNSFPNVNGVGKDSLNSIRSGLGGYMDWANDYCYVPGLRQDDPGSFILMYYHCPTRWTWHGGPPTVFKEKAWIVVPVDFAFWGGRSPEGPGEMSERISTQAFKMRLRNTIEFVRTNARPNWQTVVAEHTRVLEAVERASP